MQAAARECWSWELEGRSPSRPPRMEEGDTVEGEPGFCGSQSGRRRIFELPREFDARGSWRAGRPPDLFGLEKTVPRREFPASVVRGRERGRYAGCRGEFSGRGSWRGELEGRSPSRPLRIGEDGTGEGEPRFCGAQSGRRRYAELLRGFDARGSRRAGRPPDLPAREKNKVG